jgi:hypothetical protein
MTDLSIPLSGRQANGQFAHGNPGRRLGARNRLSHRVVMAMLKDFEENGAELLDYLRTHDKAKYFAILARLAPKLLAGDTPGTEACPDAEAARLVVTARGLLDNIPNPREALEELGAILDVAALA